MVGVRLAKKERMWEMVGGNEVCVAMVTSATVFPGVGGNLLH
jgi:hypothetical protein